MELVKVQQTVMNREKYESSYFKYLFQTQYVDDEFVFLSMEVYDKNTDDFKGSFIHENGKTDTNGMSLNDISIHLSVLNEFCEIKEIAIEI